ncbi:Na+/H+ antiporter NhaA [Aureibaculum marinum]|uniref:Na(+)/H(+) antiporter NhaA n=1 Tax=Aureibaculum marinum TaxID=2487930 RepID=A0A3N4NU94_9FLAO|nr:Na+/H+ antiporter NhaA [Aureibaculum marinum]RPD99941.1 Na+/H+ antiporter NhaA [Aureibaculum marinum]
MIKKVLVTPFQKFVQIESFSGILLLIATIVALIWANSPLSIYYTQLQEFKMGFTSDSFTLSKPLILWVNDGLMAIFFFLIGLEIKREFLIGGLNSAKKIAFPLIGALGGVIIPVAFYLILNNNPDTVRGWGVPMATDIAFSLAVLNALGKRVPLSLKLFLTAFAIVDDLAAVLVIAIFYSANISLGLLGIALGLLAFLYFLSYKGYYSKFMLVSLGIVIWVLFLKSGLHPTLAGVLLAFSVPVMQKIKTITFIENLENIVSNIRQSPVLEEPILSKEQKSVIHNLEGWTKKYKSPLQNLEHKLHDWVGYLIIPVFALFNAGVAISGDMNLETVLVVNIVVALVLGKSIGVSSAVLFFKKIKLIQVPSDITNRHIIGVSFLAGIGFTMAIFIASLAFADTPQYIDSAKIGVLLGSLLSAIIGYIVLRIKSK